MSEVINKLFVHYDGTKQDFIDSGYPDKYHKSIVFINGDGDESNNMIYTHGEYYGYTKDSLKDIIGLGEIFTEVSVIGDSISTYENWIPNGYNNYYPLTVDDKAVNSVTQTYWHKLIYNKMYNAYLGVNNSYSGSTITKITDDTSTRADFCFRFINEGLGNPDVIIIHGGVNDCTTKSDGTYRANLYNGATGMAPSTAPTKAYLEGLCDSANQISTYNDAVNTLPDNYFVDAYIKLLTLIRIKHPQAKVVSIISEWLTKRTVDALKIILNHFNRTYGYNYINFWESEGFKGSTNITKISSAHPDVNGFNYIANKIYDTFSSYLNKSSVIKYDVPMTYSEGEHSIINKRSGSISSGKYAVAIGADNIFGEASPVEGDKLEYCTASGYASHAEGSAHALGAYSHAEGGGNTDVTEEGYHVVSTAEGECSHAEGTHTYAYGGASHAEGNRTKAIGSHSHAEGRRTTASGSGSHAEGKETTASGLTSHAEGEGATASGEASHAEGYITKSSGKYSHAEGNETEASGTDSHAEGKLTIAQGANSHAEGFNTLASGVCGHAEGYQCVASGDYSHASGKNTTASNSAEFVCGKYNHSYDGVIFNVGIGKASTETEDNSKSAFLIDNSGNVYVNGVGSFNVNGQKDIEECNAIHQVINALSVSSANRTGSTESVTINAYINQITYFKDNAGKNVTFSLKGRSNFTDGMYIIIIEKNHTHNTTYTFPGYTQYWLNGLEPSYVFDGKGVYELNILISGTKAFCSIAKFNQKQ